MDQIYLTCDEENIIFLDCTRLDGSKKLVSRNNPDDTNNVSNQVFEISKKLLRLGKNKIFLVDDFIGSGSQILNVLNFLEEKGICDKTIYIITYACYELGEFNINKFNENSKNNIILKYKIMEKNYLG